MRWLNSQIRWIMLISGALTCTMFQAMIAPQSVLQRNFGQVLEGPVAGIVVRNWGALIGLVGLMLIYGAFTPAVRGLVLTIAAVSKVIFISLVLTVGPEFLNQGVRIAVVVDTVCVLLFALLLLPSGRRTSEFSASARAPNT